VHGDRSSSEYAKIRKESLETQFGRILGSSSRRHFADHGFGPFLAMYRAATISFHVVKLTIWHLWLNDMQKRAEKVLSFSDIGGGTVPNVSDCCFLYFSFESP
jgi:aarF domain-containing kinase